jgi:hypothetical protein
MGWIERMKSIICGLKASGKSEKEIEQIVQQAADKATVGGGSEYGIKAQDAVDALTYAVAAQARYRVRTESNNWRKMHRLPMRRKGKRR